MKLLEYPILIFLMYTFSLNLNAQPTTKTYSLKKGEVLDILVLSAKPDTNNLFDTFKKTAIPVAIQMSYKPLVGFSVAKYTQGNHQPQSLIFGTWEHVKKREKFIAEIEGKVPDFHAQRQNIWSFFGLTYYEMPKDISFKINNDKYIVVTSYWQKEGKGIQFEQFKKNWIRKSNNAGGQIILELMNGKSPFGYYYNPDYQVITQWENKVAFEVFYKENLKMNHDAIKHVNQFVIN